MHPHTISRPFGRMLSILLVTAAVLGAGSDSMAAARPPFLYPAEMNRAADSLEGIQLESLPPSFHLQPAGWRIHNRKHGLQYGRIFFWAGPTNNRRKCAYSYSVSAIWMGKWPELIMNQVYRESASCPIGLPQYSYLDVTP